MSKILRVGFDLDGVILYNPARIIRPIISLLKKKNLMKRKQLQFFVPKTKLQEIMWYLFHKSSIFVAPGLDEVCQLVKAGKLEAYIITGRFSHLKNDFNKWQKKMEASNIFKACYLNEKDEQPHLFKEKMINKLKLDVFIEDNADIVDYLASKFGKNKKKAEIFWVYNLFDKRLAYPLKFAGLKQAVQALKIRLNS